MSGTGISPRIPCAVTVVPTKSFATIGGIIEINLFALTDAAAPREAGDRGRHPRHGRVRAVHQGRRVPAALRADGDRRRRPRRRQARVAAFRRAGACRLQPGGGGLRLCRGAVPGRRHGDGATCCGRNISSPTSPSFPASRWPGRRGSGAQPHPFVCVQTPAAMPAPGAAFIADFWIPRCRRAGQARPGSIQRSCGRRVGFPVYKPPAVLPASCRADKTGTTSAPLGQAPAGSADLRIDLDPGNQLREPPDISRPDG